MNRPVPAGDLLDAAPSSLAPREIAQRQPKPPAQAGGECLNNPNAKAGFYVDHREDGGPLLLVPDDELKVIDVPAREVEPDIEDPAGREFDWRNDEDVLLPEQTAIAVYLNPKGGLVIRQERRWDEDQDTIIVIARNNVMPFIDKLTDVAGIPSIP